MSDRITSFAYWLVKKQLMHHLKALIWDYFSVKREGLALPEKTHGHLKVSLGPGEILLLSMFLPHFIRQNKRKNLLRAFRGH